LEGPPALASFALPDLPIDFLTLPAVPLLERAEGLLDMHREDLVAERIVIESYSEMIRYLGDDDPSTRRMLEEILAEELLERLGKGEDERNAR
jgi:bacterioferritin (cytochrome b1)